jgi:hypothetical protein
MPTNDVFVAPTWGSRGSASQPVIGGSFHSSYYGAVGSGG